MRVKCSRELLSELAKLGIEVVRVVLLIFALIIILFKW